MNITRVRNCPDVTTLNSLFGLCIFELLSVCFFSFCLFVFLSFYLFVFLSFCLFVTLIKCFQGLKSQKPLFPSKQIFLRTIPQEMQDHVAIQPLITIPVDKTLDVVSQTGIKPINKYICLKSEQTARWHQCFTAQCFP